MMFYFVAWFPIGFIHYITFARGAVCTCTSLIVFMLCVLWSRPAPRLADDEQPLEPWERACHKHAAAPTLSAMFREDVHTRKDKRRPPGTRACAWYACGRCEAYPAQFDVCARCRVAYCSKRCQVRDWEANHRFACADRSSCEA
eukprot:TRINITY_DN9083_c1_g2_i1.p2 TRINITY_DN9083_c1_g2~~TRINITY_DN9083_c1_g2_i1.p2  ORF type:complete len:144 (-),score=34.09 TRINITY_DN9083_c1_g2_i1:203-634(-)